METISFDDFKKVEIRIGKILSAEKVEGSDKLLKLQVDFGFEQAEVTTMENEAPKPVAIPIRRQIIAGIAKFYAPEALIGKECPFAYNLAPRMLAGLESQGMIMCPSGEAGPVLLHPDKEVPPGSLIK
ncbi:MAG: methionine--tRNA ligase [Candidatus Staskawiczbacteria bacterium]|nr:methionine--tRNA ligase [Candidatus Staskawiczbacteria bacterium]